MSSIEITKICLLFLFLISPFIFDYIEYKKSAYYNITKNPYGLLLIDKGLRGEYLIYKKLKHFEKIGTKFLFNLYIPTYKNKTTEIDVIMICPFGIFVFESKNYSGWIFGNENQKYWTQTFHVGYGETRKEHFYNPIWQNETHIKHLTKIIKKNIYINSVVVFSNHCRIKHIYNSSDTVITYLYNLKKVINDISENTTNILTESDVQELYDVLYKYTQVSKDVRQKHIMDIYNIKSQ